jgi:DNA helicase HerA-like ATPase
MADPLLIARHDTIECALLPGLANRHGLITGATGTGKTVTLQTIAEQLSNIGVPVFMADVKGDLTGASQKGSIGEKMAATLKERGIELPRIRSPAP